jgi:tripartite-type tricarboxylate transporter receptor subunit TctC
MKSVSAKLFALLLISSSTYLPISASGDEYPQRTIKLVVAVAAGGGVDALARILAFELQKRLGQSVIVENRPGAGTTLATRAVASSAPDGYTLIVGSTNHVIAPVFFNNLGYDPLKSFSPVALVASWSHVLVVRPALPVKTVAELVEYAKSNPGKVTFGFGTGTPPQILGEYLKVLSGADIASIAYRGSLEAITEMLGDRIDMNFSPIATLSQLINQGKLRPIAYTGVKRLAQLPDVPTMTESGFPQLSFNPDNWVGILAPAGTPPNVVTTLNVAINDSLKSPELTAKFAQLSFDASAQTVEEFERFFAEQSLKWPPIVKAAGLKSF